MSNPLFLMLGGGGGGKARGVYVVPMKRTYHWFTSMVCKNIQLKKEERGADCASYGLVML